MDKEQVEHVFARLKALGVSKLVACYSGGGDSGQFERIDAYDVEGQYMTSIDLDAPIGQEDPDVLAKQVAASLLNTKLKSFTGEIEQMTWDAVDVAGHDGFWNDEGGEGQLVFDVAGRKVFLEHRDRIESWEETDTGIYEDES